MTLTDYLNYYSNELIIQYNGLPKASQTVQCFVNCALADGLPMSLQTAFNLSTAVGNQLTILGKIVGVPRNVQGLDLTHQFWSVTTYSQGTAAGTSAGRYSNNPYPSTLMKRYFTNATYVSSDFELNTLIKMKILFNTQTTTLSALVIGFYSIFGNLVSVKDNLNMTLTINVKNPYYNVFKIASYLNIIPRAMGVSITVNYI